MKRWLVPAVLLFVLAGAWFLSPDPLALSSARLAPPGPSHLLGTDPLGRDVLARLLAAAPGSLGLALAGLAAALGLGLATALSAAGWEAHAAGRAIDGVAQGLLSFPPLWLPLVVLALAGPGAGEQTVCVALVLWADLHWLLRGEARRILAEPFIETARGLGFGRPAILVREVLPNLAGPCLWLGLVKLRGAIVLLATLAFLGLGRPPPAPSWGGMIAESRDWFLDAPWLLVAPTLAIAASLLLAAWAAGALRDRIGLGRVLSI